MPFWYTLWGRTDHFLHQSPIFTGESDDPAKFSESCSSTKEGRTERRYALCSIKNVTALRHGPTHWHQKLAANMSEGSRSWHERVSANTRDYFQGLVACQTQHKAGLREQHFCWSRRGWQWSRADARGETWRAFGSGTALGLCREQLLFAVSHCCVSHLSVYLQWSAQSAYGMGHLSDFYTHVDIVFGGELGASLCLHQVTPVSFRFESLYFCQHQGPSTASLISNPYLPSYPEQPQGQ